MIVTVQLFARARDLAGVSSVAVELPAGATAGELRSRLAESYPAMARLLRHCLLAVDNDFAEDTVVLSPRVEIALLPPVSGG